MRWWTWVWEMTGPPSSASVLECKSNILLHHLFFFFLTSVTVNNSPESIKSATFEVLQQIFTGCALQPTLPWAFVMCSSFFSWSQMLQHQVHSVHGFPRACTFWACVLVPCWLCLDACQYYIPKLVFLISVWGAGDRVCRCSTHAHTHTQSAHMHSCICALWWYRRLVGSVGGNFPECCCRKTFRWKKNPLFLLLHSLQELSFGVGSLRCISSSSSLTFFSQLPSPSFFSSLSIILLFTFPGRSQSVPHTAPWSLGVTDQTDPSFAFITCSLCCF